MPHIAYHLTPSNNLASIMTEGLTPRIGALAAVAGEHTPAVWLFPGPAEAAQALTNWYGEATDLIDKIALLGVTIPEDARISAGTGYEVAVLTRIPADHLTIITEDVDSFSFR